MDSLLSNAQRCARKADSLASQGSFDEAFTQLDKSISFLNNLKRNTSNYETIQILNVQIESVDRKMRSMAIKRSENMQLKHYNDKKAALATATAAKTNSLIYNTTNNLTKIITSPTTHPKLLTYQYNTITENIRENDFKLNPLEKFNSTSDDENHHQIDDSDEDDDEDFYEETLAANFHEIIKTNLNNTRSSTLTSSSSCSSSSAFSSMSNLSSNCGMPIKHENNNKAIDLSKYINNEDSEDSDSNIENNYFSTSKKNSARPNEFFID
jgi:hypothetical protein